MIDCIAVSRWVDPSDVISMRSAPGVNMPVQYTALTSQDGMGQVERQRVHGQGFFVDWRPEERLLTVRISVARLWNMKAGGVSANWPLPSAAALAALDLRKVTRDILHVIGQPVGDDAENERQLNLMAWGVSMVAYTLDVRVLDALVTIGVLALLTRKGKGSQDHWASPGRPAHAAQWDAGGRRVQFYDKQFEMLNKLRKLKTLDHEFSRRSARFLDERHQAAEGTVRMEVTLYTLDAIRNAVGIMDSQQLPTLRLMLMPEVMRWVMSRELGLLRLTNIKDIAPEIDPAINTEALGGRLLFDTFLVHQADYNARVPPKKRISNTRLRALYMTAGLMGQFSRAELLDKSYKPATLSKDLRELALLGLAATGVTDANVQAILAEWVDAVGEQLGGVQHPKPDCDLVSQHLAWAPRAEGADAARRAAEDEGALDDLDGVGGPDDSSGGPASSPASA